MSVYPNLASGQSDIADNIGNQTEPRSITPSSHSGVLDNIVETIFQYSAGTGEDTLRATVLDSGLTFIQIPESTFIASLDNIEVAKTTTNDWKKHVGIGNAVIEKVTNIDPSYNFDLSNSGIGSGPDGKIWLENLVFEGKAVVDPTDFNVGGGGIFLGLDTSDFEKVHDIRIFHCTIRNQSNTSLRSWKGGNNYDILYNRVKNSGRDGYFMNNSFWGIYGFNRLDTNGDDGIAINKGCQWNTLIGNIMKRAGSDFTVNAATSYKINGRAILLGNISYRSRGHIVPSSEINYDLNHANMTHTCQHSKFAFTIGHGLGPPDELAPEEQNAYRIEGNLNLFVGNTCNSVQAVDKVDESLGDSIGTCHRILKQNNLGRTDFVNEIFEGGRIELVTSNARHIRFKRCKFLTWIGQNNSNWYDVHILRGIANRKFNRIDFIGCEFEHAAGCIFRAYNDVKINRINIINCREYMWNNVAELAGDEDSTAAIEIDDTPTTLEISRIANDWKGWKARWSSGQEFYLCTYDSNGNVVYDTIILAQDVYPNMGSGDSVTININSFTATNHYLYKNTWLALKKRVAIDGTRGIVQLNSGCNIDVINIIDKSYLGSNNSLSGYKIKSGAGTVNTTFLNGVSVASTTTI
jgi:hypothetical protein